MAKDTAIYGVSSIVGRFLNYLLVPLYVTVMPASTGEYGILTNMYAIIGLLMVVLTYGMETGFFRFANEKGDDPMRVYSSILLSIGTTSLLFLLLTLSFLHPIADFMGYGAHPEYMGIMLVVVAVDAFLTIPFAFLRFKKRPIKFAAIKFFNILVNILLNLFFLLLCPWLSQRFPDLFAWYNPDYRAGYVFVANLIASFSQILFFIPELRGFRYVYDAALMKRIFRYSFPILILGIAGILNQTVDKIIYPFLFADKTEASVQLGIYGAASKIAMIMAMCLQAFRYAYEPFVFGKNREGDNRTMYAQAMKFFIIFTLLGFLAVMFYLDILKYIIKPDYWEGLRVVPIVMVAEMLMGVYFNLSFWYKLIDETRWGAYFSGIGCVVIIALNVLLVPTYGYIASAWAGLVGYATVTLLSYFIGQKKYPIAYDLRSIGLYVLLAAVLYVVGQYTPIDSVVLRLLFRTVLLLLFVGYIVKRDLPLNQLPYLKRFSKK